MVAPEEFLTVILPCGKGLVILYALYGDESSDSDSGRLIVAAYLITSGQFSRLVPAWIEGLQDLPYFHFSEGHHTSHPDVYRSLISLITPEYFTVGFSASVFEHEYKSVTSVKLKNQTLAYWFGSSYTYCLWSVINQANSWLDSTNPNERDVAYVFDAGHARQGQAGMFFDQILTDPLRTTLKHRLRFYSNTFTDGKRREAGPLQAADMLAANLTNYHRTGKFSEFGAAIDSVDVYGCHHTPDKIKAAFEAQLDWCQVYGEMRRSNIIRSTGRW